MNASQQKRALTIAANRSERLTLRLARDAACLHAAMLTESDIGLFTPREVVSCIFCFAPGTVGYLERKHDRYCSSLFGGPCECTPDLELVYQPVKAAAS